MVFASPIFLFMFLPLTLAAYFAFPRTWRNGVLLVASLAFYAWGEARYLPLIVGSVAFNWTMGRAIGTSNDPRRRRGWLAAAVAGNLAALALFKYANFAVANVNALAPVLAPVFPVWPLAVAAIPLPLGISFFTFHAISYVVDVYKRNADAERSVSRFALYIVLFPQLIAGPIIRWRDIAAQLGSREQRIADFAYGVRRFVLGLGKKVLIANTLGRTADSIFGLPASELTAPLAWLGLACYTLQIYFDFSGYSDMAIGLMRMFGFRILENFNYPYIARSIREFWRRWHISLSNWFRDYLYIPLGGNRKGEARRFVNLFTTMLLGGIWHGAGWTFVIWGGMHGAAQTIAHGWVAIGKHRRLPRIPGWLGWPITMIFVMFAWVPFRSADLTVMMRMWSAMLGGAGFDVPAIGIAKPLLIFGGSSVPVNFGSPAILTMAGAALVALLAPNSQQIMARFDMGLDSPGYLARGRPSRITLRMGWFSCLFVGILLGLAIRSIGGYSEFIYFQF